MGLVGEIHLMPSSLERFAPIVGEAALVALRAEALALSRRLAGRSVWNVSSTAVGGGVAEMLRTLLAYARGAGIDVRWAVIGGSPAFFRVTKRLHNALHGEPGDGTPLGPEERAVYEATARENTNDLLALVRARDVVILHDPQTAGLAPVLLRAGALVVWRCHIGSDEPDGETELGWSFLSPYLAGVRAVVFSREAYVPRQLERCRSVVIVPSIDPFSPKNQPMDDATVRAVLAHVGIVEGPPGPAEPRFFRADGSPGRVDRAVDVVRLGRAVAWEAPLIVQVSRWDALKDPIGVLEGFADLARTAEHGGAELLLAGPNVSAVADDPDGARVFEQVTRAFRALPHAVRKLVHLASLPTADVEENAAIVNAIQRHAAIVVQKSLREGFGLTVTEAMWKARPIVASAVGGIKDQIEDGVHGLLLGDPRDPGGLTRALSRLLCDRALASRLGEAARARAKARFLGVRHLLDYAELIEHLDRLCPAAPP